jgi:outer membrane beta-barrel protein
MENLFQRVLLKWVLIACAACTLGAPAWSDEEATVGDTDSGQVIEPELDREEADVPNIDSQDIEVGLYYGFMSIQDFKNSSVLGATAAWHLTEDLFFEGAYGQAKGDLTSFEELSGGAPLIEDSDRDFTTYNVSLGWNALPGEVFIRNKWAFKSDFFVIAGVGNTKFAGDNEFTINAGVGYRFLVNDWLALRIDVRDYILDRTLFGKKESTHNLEVRTGITVFF